MKNEPLDRVQVLTSLYQLHTVVTHSQFDQRLNLNLNRFPTDGSAHSDDLMTRILRQYVDEPIDSEYLLYMADKIAAIWSVKIAKKHRRVSMPRGRKEAVLAIFTWLDNHFADLHYALMAIDYPKHQDCLSLYNISTYNIRHGLTNLYHAFTAKRVLAETTGIASYERILAKYVPHVDYMVNGYPLDLLCHDYNIFRKGQAKDRKWYVLKESHCTTHIIAQEMADTIKAFGGNWDWYELDKLAA